jgi:hypothetical protein
MVRVEDQQEERMNLTGETKKQLLAERRAKLAKLRGEVFVQDRSITSAPNLTLVDEFHETFGTADQRHSGVETVNTDLTSTDHKIFSRLGAQPLPVSHVCLSNLETNVLVAEANKRDQQKISGQQDPQLQQEMHSPEVALTAEDTLARLGQGDDQDYQAFLSPPNESQAGEAAQRQSSINVSATIQEGLIRVADGLSQSLPEGCLKTDLAQSLGTIAEQAKSRGIYDPGRLFEGEGVGGDCGGDVTEREYFQRMRRMQGVRDAMVGRSQSFQCFIHQSFNEAGSRDARWPAKENNVGDRRVGVFF